MSPKGDPLADRGDTALIFEYYVHALIFENNYTYLCVTQDILQVRIILI